MWTCQKCQTDVEETFDVCWQCGTSREGVEDPNFVVADESGPIDDPIEGNSGAELPLPAATTVSAGLVECYQAFSLMEARFLADRLAGEGIEAISDAHDLQDALGTWSGNPRVYVKAEDLDRARSWLQAYDARRKEEFQQSPGDHLED